MKIEYDVTLYKRIANFSVNEVVQVKNRKGKRSTIHITNITQLSWQDLQLLVSNGADRFTKMVLVYQEYLSEKELSNSVLKGKPLTSDESTEINEYIKIYRSNGFTKHHEVNEFITDNKIWDNFSTVRSLNDHGQYKSIEGIQPKYFEIICNILKISGEKGMPLDGYTTY